MHFRPARGGLRCEAALGGADTPMRVLEPTAESASQAVAISRKKKVYLIAFRSQAYVAMREDAAKCAAQQAAT